MLQIEMRIMNKHWWSLFSLQRKILHRIVILERYTPFLLQKNNVKHLIYTKEDEIYKITDIVENELGRKKEKRKSSRETETNLECASTNLWKQKEEHGQYEIDKEKIMNNSLTDEEPQYVLFKNKIRIPLYWYSKLKQLKNINAINCLEYLKDDNFLYYDNYKDKGLLKFLNEEKRRYNNCIILARVGDFYETYGLDSIFLIEFLNIRKMNNKLSCGFIKTSINKALRILTNNNLNICIYEEISDKSLKMKNRYLSQIVTPEFPLYINNVQYSNDTDESNSYDETNINIKVNDNEAATTACSFFNSQEIEDCSTVKEIVSVFIESKNIFSLSKINLSVKTISIYDDITFDVLNIYLKNTDFVKAYIHQHHNSTFTKKITQLFKIENYYLFSNFSNSFDFHMFILDKLKKQINIQGLFRLIRNKNIFNVHPTSSNTNHSQETDKQNAHNDTPPFEYSYYSYCTPLNIFTSYNMGIYKQNNHYENRNNFLLFNILDVDNTDAKSIHISESLEFFKNLFLFFPPFSITKHIRYINQYIAEHEKELVIPNVKPFKNNIVIALLSNLKADHMILKKIYSNVQSVLQCMRNFEFSLLVSMFHVLNQQNCFKLNIIKFYELLIKIEQILTKNLDSSNSPPFSYECELPLFTEFVQHHEKKIHNLINEELLQKENEEIEKNRTVLLRCVIEKYANTTMTEGKQRNLEYNIEELNKILKIDTGNDMIGIKRKSKKEEITHFYHPLNKKSEMIKNVYVTEEVDNCIKNYVKAVERKKKSIHEIIRKVNIQLSSSVQILSFVSNFLQVIQALYNHTLNSLKRQWSLPICKHLFVSYKTYTIHSIDEKLKIIQSELYKDEEIEEKKMENNEQKRSELQNNYDYKFIDEETTGLDLETIKEIKKIYEEVHYVNDSINYILGIKPYNMKKGHLVPYDVFFKKKNFMVLTGKNMSGKTTLSFSILCILFLSNLGLHAPCNKNSIISKFREFYSLKNVNYNEQIENMSLFREQAFYINSIIKEIKENGSFEEMTKKKENQQNSKLIQEKNKESEIFVLLDEPCIATTPLDNAIIISALSDYLKNLCGIIITHNYDLLNKIGLTKNITFKKINQHIHYLQNQTYQKTATLENGICKNSEALETCRHTNTDKELLQLLNYYEKKYKLIQDLHNSLYYAFLHYVNNKKEKKNLFLSNFFEQFLHYHPEYLEEAIHIFRESTNETDPKIDKNHLSNKYVEIGIKENSLECQEYNGKENIVESNNAIKKEKIGNSKEANEHDMMRGSINVKQELIEKENEFIENNSKNEEKRNHVFSNNTTLELYEKEINKIIQHIEQVIDKKIMKIHMNEEVPIFFKNKSIVYMLCIFEKHNVKPYFYIGISDNISERIKCHTRNIINDRNILKKKKRNNILNYTFNTHLFYTLLFYVDNKHIASKYEKELTQFLNPHYYILSK